jgi:hypothetical protein
MIFDVLRQSLVFSFNLCNLILTLQSYILDLKRLNAEKASIVRTPKQHRTRAYMASMMNHSLTLRSYIPYFCRWWVIRIIYLFCLETHYSLYIKDSCLWSDDVQQYAKSSISLLSIEKGATRQYPKSIPISRYSFSCTSALKSTLIVRYKSVYNTLNVRLEYVNCPLD